MMGIILAIVERAQIPAVHPRIVTYTEYK